MTIYTQDLTEIQNLATTNYSVEELINRFNRQTLFGNSAQNAQCVICVKINDCAQKEVGGKINTPVYKERLRNILRNLGNMKRRTFNYNVEIGRWLIKQNDPNNYTLSKSEIKSRIDQENGKTENNITPRTKVNYKQENQELRDLNTSIADLYEDAKELISDYEIMANHYREMIENRDGDWQGTLKKIGVKNHERL